MKDGGSAFPFDHMAERVVDHVTSPGMTMRDYFAAQAMTGFLLGARSAGWAVPDKFQNEMLAANAYATADAMLAERSK